MAEGATDTTGVTGLGYPIRTIEGTAAAQQYANGVAWDFRIVNGAAEICDMYYTSDGEVHYRAAIDADTTGALVIPDTLGGSPVTRIGNYAFSFCKKITSVTIPASVTSIGEGAFEYCEALTDATIPGSVKSIGHSAFEGCDGLTSVTIMDGVETIEKQTFRYCGGLTGITIPASVKTVEQGAFENCTSLATMNVSDGTTIEDGAFRNCNALADANGFVIIRDVLHQYVGGDANVTVPPGLTRIGGMAFAEHTSNFIFGKYPPLVSVTIPDSVTSIGAMAFAYCLELENVTFPVTMPRVEDGAFAFCVKLADADGFIIIGGALHSYVGTASVLTIPVGVTSIGPQSFITYTGVPPYYYWISPVTNLTIPSGVTNISFYAFAYCPGLMTVSIPSTVTCIEEGAFYEMLGGTFPLNTVHVEAGDTERVKALFVASEHPVDGINWIEDYVPPVLDPGPGYALLNESDITAPYAVAKAVTLKGAANDGGNVVGIVELKLGKVNLKKKTSTVSGSFIGLDGKKRTMKAVTITGIDGTAPATVTLDVKGVGTMTVVIGGTQFAGTLGKWHVQSANVGGNWTKRRATAEVAVGDLSVFAGTVLAENEVATVSRGKWTFAKAASVKYAKPKAGQATATPVDATGKGLIVDTAKGKSNLSGLKFVYTPKKGTFKDSFKVYAIEGTKLKKYTVTVNGVVVDGVGYGKATCKKPTVSWPVTVE